MMKPQSGCTVRPCFLLVFVIFIIVCLNIHAFLSWSRNRASNTQHSNSACDEPVVVMVKNPMEVVNLRSKNFAPRNDDLLIKKEFVSLLGARRNTTGFITIGVPSIRRVNGPDYLLQTLSSLVERVTDAEKAQVTVVVFLADLDADYNKYSAKKIQARFPSDVSSGFLQIVRITREYYPPLEGLKRNFGDAPDRVRWRAKQVADFSFMFAYARNISKYYIQVEDDVECSHGFVSSMRDYIEECNLAETRGSNWTMLEFSELGFIGKLFRSIDLDRLARYMRMFYAEQPVDWLMSYFRLSMGQRKIYMRKPTLFQHFGVKSSFDLSKDNLLKDRYFDPGNNEWTGASYPSATLLSTMPPYKKHSVEMAYFSGDGFFWATKVLANDTVHMLFDVEQRDLIRVVVATGNEENPKDVLDAGSVLFGSSIARVDFEGGTAECQNLQKVATFVNGNAVVENVQRHVSFPVRCMQIRVDASLDHWVLFRRIAIFKRKNHHADSA